MYVRRRRRGNHSWYSSRAALNSAMTSAALDAGLEPPPPYSLDGTSTPGVHFPKPPDYESGEAPPPPYSASPDTSQDENWVTISFHNQPGEPPPAYEISIISRPSLNSSGAQLDTSATDTTSVHDTTVGSGGVRGSRLSLLPEPAPLRTRPRLDEVMPTADVGGVLLSSDATRRLAEYRMAQGANGDPGPARGYVGPLNMFLRAGSSQPAPVDRLGQPPRRVNRGRRAARLTLEDQSKSCQDEPRTSTV